MLTTFFKTLHKPVTVTVATFCYTSEGSIFAIKSLILTILVLEDRYESPLSIDTKNVPVALHLTSQWRSNDVRVTKKKKKKGKGKEKKKELQIFSKNMLIFTFLPNILRKYNFDGDIC